jgi:arogenate dehydrogenase (NADP+)
LGAIESTVSQLIPHLKPETILTDVGSVKGPIVHAIAPLWPNFVGGHPMAGTAESGLNAAQRHLFVDRPYVLTPTSATPPAIASTLATLVKQLDAHLYECSPNDHDRAVAWISHLPVMVSASLIRACSQEADPHILQLAHQLASSGFRDTSRVGGGNPELGTMMAHYNRAELLHTLQLYRHQLESLTTLIEQNRWADLENVLSKTQSARTQFAST